MNKNFLLLLVDMHKALPAITIFLMLFLGMTEPAKAYLESPAGEESQLHWIIASLLLSSILAIRPAIFAFTNYHEFLASRRTKYVNSKVNMEKLRLKYAFQVYLVLVFSFTTFFMTCVFIGLMCWDGYLF